jgi:hypothetical protein
MWGIPNRGVGDLRREAGAAQEPIVVTDVDAHFQSVVCKRTITLRFGQCDEGGCPHSRGQDSVVSDCDEWKEKRRGLALRSKELGE